VAREQPDPELVLQQADLPAERWLGDVQPVGGPAEAAELRDLQECPELPEIHGLDNNGISE
jgi:hypothetical protein